MSKTFFIADLHFGHINVIKYDHRPFTSIEDHDKELITRWNSRVSDDDIVWILGDISMKPTQYTIDLTEQLRGHKMLIIGNHDIRHLKSRDFCNLFGEIAPYKEILLDDKRKVVLCHYPIICFNGHFHGTYHLYGHVHSSFEYDFTENAKLEMINKYGKKCNMYNVGTMMPYIDYAPRTLDEIIAANEVESNEQEYR